jgi:hypothetical protein
MLLRLRIDCIRSKASSGDSVFTTAAGLAGEAGDAAGEGRTGAVACGEGAGAGGMGVEQAAVSAAADSMIVRRFIWVRVRGRRSKGKLYTFVQI